MTIGEKIEFLRKAKGFSQGKLGLALGYSKPTAENRILIYENGQTKPKIETLERISRALEVSPSIFCSENPVEQVIQNIFWLTPEERLDVCIALEELDQKEDMAEYGSITEDELSL